MHRRQALSVLATALPFAGCSGEGPATQTIRTSTSTTESTGTAPTQPATETESCSTEREEIDLPDFSVENERDSAIDVEVSITNTEPEETVTLFEQSYRVAGGQRIEEASAIEEGLGSGTYVVTVSVGGRHSQSRAVPTIVTAPSNNQAVIEVTNRSTPIGISVLHADPGIYVACDG
jgi:hypothetical protein